MARSSTGGGRRKPNRRPQRRRFLIACEGQKEVEYFRHLGKKLGSQVSLQPVHRHSAPEQVLKLALDQRTKDRDAARSSGDSSDVYDGVWMVVDCDEHANLAQTLREAAAAGVSAAVSGPCFEVWLILHLEDRRSAYSSPKAAKEAWAKLVGAARTAQQELAKTGANTAIALKRANALLADHAAADTPRHQRNPSTEVGLLVAAISQSVGVSLDNV